MATFIALFILAFSAILLIRIIAFILATGTAAVIVCVPVAIVLVVIGLVKRLFSHK